MYYDAGTISFPGLGIEGINPPRTLPFTIVGKEIYYYGLIIALGFLLAILYARKRVKEFGTNFDLVTDAILWAAPTAIVCARIYYVVFRWDLYKDNPITALYIWQGGIAIYGAVIGAILGLVLFSRVHKQKLPPYLDIMALGLLIGQLIGRWGNFFNREGRRSSTISSCGWALRRPADLCATGTPPSSMSPFGTSSASFSSISCPRSESTTDRPSCSTWPGTAWAGSGSRGCGPTPCTSAAPTSG